MELTTEQQQALETLAGALKITGSQDKFDDFFREEMQEISECKTAILELQEQFDDLRRYNDTTIDSFIDIVEEYVPLKRRLNRLEIDLLNSKKLLKVMGVTLK